MLNLKLINWISVEIKVNAQEATIDKKLSDIVIAKANIK